MAWQNFLNTFVEAGVLTEFCRLKVDGKFEKRTHIMTLAYQIREMVLLSPNNGGDGAGVVGPITQNQALKQGWSRVPDEDESDVEIESSLNEEEELR